MECGRTELFIAYLNETANLKLRGIKNKIFIRQLKFEKHQFNPVLMMWIDSYYIIHNLVHQSRNLNQLIKTIQH